MRRVLEGKMRQARREQLSHRPDHLYNLSVEVGRVRA
jgi:hypothetical protein